MYFLVRNEAILGMQELEVLDSDIKMITATDKQINNVNLYGVNYYIYANGAIVPNPNYQKEQEEAEQERVKMLKMTPLDFINAIETLGVEYAQIKALCDSNLEVEKQFRFCNHVYRGNPLLDQLCGQFGITSEQLDELFKKYGE